MKRTFAEAMAHRRSYYSIGSDLSVLDEEIVHIPVGGINLVRI